MTDLWTNYPNSSIEVCKRPNFSGKIHKLFRFEKRAQCGKLLNAPVEYLSRGEMQEWLNWTLSKSVVPLPVPRVRIPVSPPRTCIESENSQMAV
jgi:hypothetical protein